MILGSFQAQRARVIAAADALVLRPVRPLALARAVPRYYISLAARAMEFALGAAHCARLHRRRDGGGRRRRDGMIVVGAALIHASLLLYHVDGVRRAASSGGGNDDAC